MAKAKAKAKVKTEKPVSDKPKKPRAVVFGPASCYTRFVDGMPRYTVSTFGFQATNFNLPSALRGLADLLETSRSQAAA